jgi:hypothetical protein
MIAERIQAAEGQGEDLLPTDVAVGHSARITIRLRDSELAILTQAAKNAVLCAIRLLRASASVKTSVTVHRAVVHRVSFKKGLAGIDHCVTSGNASK